MAVERDKTGAVAQQTAEAAAEATNAVKAAMERVGATESEVAYWRHWRQQRVEISTRPERSVADAMPAVNATMAERQRQQARKLAS